MQALIREKLMQALESLGPVIDVYRKDSSRFFATYFRWLEQTEEALAGLRLPMVATVQSQKSQMMALEDGLVPAYVQATVSPRKRQRAVAAALLESLSGVLQAQISQIDTALADPLDKFSQAAALLSVKQPDWLDSIAAVNTQTVAQVWQTMRETPELAQVMVYLAARVDRTDREYCLQQVLSRLLP